MELESITIGKNRYATGADKGKFTAKCVIKGGSTYPADINIEVPAEMLEPIVRIMQQAVAESMSRAAAQFADEVAGSLMAPIEHEAITKAEPVADDICF